MAKIEWNEQNKKSFTSAVKIAGDSDNKDVVQYSEYILSALKFGDTTRLVKTAKEGFAEYGIGFEWNPARYSNQKLNDEVSEMENLLRSCFDVSAYDDSTSKGKRFLSTNTKTKKDGTKDKPRPLTGDRIVDSLIAKVRRAAKAEDTK